MRLHARLEQDCHQLGTTATSIVLINRNASIPWFLLVPDTELSALYQMSRPQRTAIEEEWNGLAAWVHKRWDCTRVNVAAIGNLVPQLHLHIVGRREGDPCWPGVIWGQALPLAEWQAAELASIRNDLRREFGLFLSL